MVSPECGEFYASAWPRNMRVVLIRRLASTRFVLDDTEAISLAHSLKIALAFSDCLNGLTDLL
jgi:hypothetical protein